MLTEDEIANLETGEEIANLEVVAEDAIEAELDVLEAMNTEAEAELNLLPVEDDAEIDEELDKTLLPLKELVKLYAHWADRKKD